MRTTIRMRIAYFPMTCDWLTKGHIKCFEWLKEKNYHIIVGLLTDKALEGYKEHSVPFEDRKYILEYMGLAVVAQDTLSPYDNLIKHKPDFIASGDGFEPEEKQAAEFAGVRLLDIDFPKTWSSSAYKHGVFK